MIDITIWFIVLFIMVTFLWILLKTERTREIIIEYLRGKDTYIGLSDYETYEDLPTEDEYYLNDDDLFNDNESKERYVYKSDPEIEKMNVYIGRRRSPS